MSRRNSNHRSQDDTKAEPREWQPTILGILCNWCSYAGADLAGSARLKYPETVRIVRVPCSGRVDPMFVLKGFQKGFDGVMVLGCHPGDCHYAKGNYYAQAQDRAAARTCSFPWVFPRNGSTSSGSPRPRATVLPRWSRR